MEQEYRLRSKTTLGAWFAMGQPETNTIAGFPLLEIPLTNNDDLVDINTEVTWEGAIRFQVEREIASVEDLARDQVRSSPGLGVEDLVERLGRASRLPGPHAAYCTDLTEMIPEVLDLVRSLPPALVPSRSLRKANFYSAHDGSLRYIGGHSWSVGRMGDAWNPVKDYESALNSMIDGTNAGLIRPEVVLLNAELNNLNRALISYELWGLQKTIGELYERLKKARELR